MKTKTLETLEEGKVVKGVIKNITEYGAFVDLGGIDGLLHITDMSWGRVNHPSEAVPGRRRGHRQGPQVQRRDRARLARPQADPGRSVEPRRRGVPAGQEGPRQGHVDHRLRRVRRARAGRRRPHPRQRDELDQEGQAPVEAPRGRPGDRVPGARGRREGQAHPPRSQAARARSLDALHREVHAGRQDRRQGPLAHRLRRLRRHRRGRRRHGPQERPLVDGQGQQPGRPLPQGRRRRSDHPLDQPRREEGLPRRQAALGRSVADHLQRVPARARSSKAKVVSHRRLRRLRARPRRRRGPHPAERPRRCRRTRRASESRSRSATRSRRRSPTSTRRIAASRSRCASARRAAAPHRRRRGQAGAARLEGAEEVGGGRGERAAPSASSSSRSSAASSPASAPKAKDEKADEGDDKADDKASRREGE